MVGSKLESAREAEWNRAYADAGIDTSVREEAGLFALRSRGLVGLLRKKWLVVIGQGKVAIGTASRTMRCESVVAYPQRDVTVSAWDGSRRRLQLSTPAGELTMYVPRLVRKDAQTLVARLRGEVPPSAAHDSGPRP